MSQLGLLLEKYGESHQATSIVVFVLAWIGQFYGHKIEGKKPSFFDDLAFLLIGPLWVAEAILRARGKSLAD